MVYCDGKLYLVIVSKSVLSKEEESYLEMCRHRIARVAQIHHGRLGLENLSYKPWEVT